MKIRQYPQPKRTGRVPVSIVHGQEDAIEILSAIDRLNGEIDIIYSNLDNVTDPVLIDSYIFELKAVHMRYQYYMRLYKLMTEGLEAGG